MTLHARGAWRRAALASIAGTAAVLGACAVGPDFSAPAAPTVGRYTAQPLVAETAAPVQRFAEAADIPAQWWALFGSEPLNALIARALAANPDLESANAALRVARENLAAQRGAALPSAELQLNTTRQTIATVLASPLDSGSTAYSLHTAQLVVSYAPDVFGGNRRQTESLQAQAEAQRFELEAARLTLSTNVVSAVIQRASTQAQIDATRTLIGLAERQLGLLQRQQAAGQIGVADIAAQEAALAQARATLPPLDRQRVQQGNQLAALLGGLPGETTLPEIPLDALQLPESLPLSLPSALVAHRPDIRAAASQLQSASALIGVARANRLPAFTLTAGGGSATERLSQLFAAGTSFWSLGLNLVQPVFDGQALLHRERAAVAGYEQAEAQYRSTVVVAFQNVADTLNAIEADARALETARQAEQATARSASIAHRQQAAGASGMLPVLIAEQASRQAALARVQAQAGRLADSAALFQALGGGWWNRAATTDAETDAAR